MKGIKSIWKHKIGKRYQGPDIQVFTGSFPDQWHPEAVRLDGMFFLNYKPLRNIKQSKNMVSSCMTDFFCPIIGPLLVKFTCFLLLALT